jgi:activator of HSP90 ATPase
MAITEETKITNSLIQCIAWNFEATSTNSDWECSANPSENIIVLSGQKKNADNKNSPVTINKEALRQNLKYILCFRHIITVAIPITSMELPAGAKKVLGLLDFKNSMARSSEEGTSLKMLGYSTTVSNANAPNNAASIQVKITANINEPGLLII